MKSISFAIATESSLAATSFFSSFIVCGALSQDR